ncbi:MAG: hypothetical protein HZB53_20030 [Chloroflexi bacterium]|nr:hypothetical protein [Chloroflexota bacterium]
MKHTATLTAWLILALALVACDGTDTPDLSATADAAGAQMQAARRAQTATASAQAARATAEARQTRQAQDAAQATAAAEAKATAQAQAAYAFRMTATADALALAERQSQATATAEAQAITRARAIAEATASAANLERAQRQAAQDAELARRAADFYAVLWPVALIAILAGIGWGAWLAYRQTLEGRRLRYSILESRAGTVVFVRDGNTHAAQLLLPPGLPDAGDFDASQAATIDAEADMLTVHTAQGVTVMPKTNPQDGEREAARRLTMRLLRAAISKAGASANRIPPARELGLPPSLWVRAVAMLKPHVTTKQGRAGGTFLEAQYPTLASLYDAVGSRRLTTALPHAGDTAGS